MDLLLAHAGQLHTMDVVGLTLSVIAAAVPGFVMARNAFRRRRVARGAAAMSSSGASRSAGID